MISVWILEQVLKVLLLISSWQTRLLNDYIEKIVNEKRKINQ